MRRWPARRCRSRPRPPRPALLVGMLVGLLPVAACQYTVDLDSVPEAAAASTIVAADGTVLAEIDGGERRFPVRFDEIAPVLRDAVVAVEDHRFWDHDGVDLRAVARALSANTTAGAIVEGGSTITQQYVRAVLLDRERTVHRKLREAALALEVERRFDKREILERYLNHVYFGNGAYGAEAAARRYFGIGAGDLDLPQAALLAALVQAPERHDPYRAPASAQARRDLVLDRMAEHGFVTDERAHRARSTPVDLAPASSRDRHRAGHFVEQVRRSLLADPALGDTVAERRSLLHRGGLRVETSLDLRLQDLAEQAVAAILVEPETDPEAALVAIDPRTGHVRAYVGGRDYLGPGPAARFDLAGQARRQAGSAFKPFVLAAALEDGIPLDTVYPAPAHLTVPIAGQSPWTVANFDEHSYGQLDLVAATVRSVNTVYAALVGDVGARRVAELAADAGVQSPLDAVPSLALGTSGVHALDLANAYATFAADGLHRAPVFVSRVLAPDGSVIVERRDPPTRVLEEATAAQLHAVLGEVVQSGTGRAARIGRPVAGKTGTGDAHRDAWFVGYTPELSTAVWVGFPEATTPMVPPTTRTTVSGGGWPAQIWARFTEGALEGEPFARFTEPTRRPVVVNPVVDVVGIPADRARAMLERAGLEIDTTPVPSREFPPGTVLAQDPTPGTPVTRGITGALEVADGAPPTTAVPALLGLTLHEARAAAAAADLGVGATFAAEQPPAPAGAGGRIWKQAPPAGATAAEGAEVHVWVEP